MEEILTCIDLTDIAIFISKSDREAMGWCDRFFPTSPTLSALDCAIQRL